MANLADGFVAQAQANPTRAAFVLGDTTLSYLALLNESNRWLVYLQTLFAPRLQPQLSPSLTREEGASPAKETRIPDRLVAWEGSNHTHLPALYLACLRAGCCLVLLDPAWPATRLQQICQNLGLRHIVTPDTEPVAAEKSLIDTKGNPGLINIAGQTDTGVAGDCFLLGFTSGSTGFPKAFIRTQQSWLATFESSRQEFNNAACGRVMAPGPLSHGLSFYAMAETLNAGGTFYCQARFSPVEVLASLSQHLIDVLVVVPTMLIALLDTPEVEAHIARTMPLRLLSAGAKLDPAILNALTIRWPFVTTSEYYGASELSFVSVAHIDEGAPADSVGRAFSGVQISIRDTQEKVLPAGETGTVWAESQMLAVGTIDTGLAATESSLQLVQKLESRDRFRATVGDIGYLDDQGYLYLMDRAHNMILSGGLNVSPLAVEMVLQQHSAIIACAVIGLEDCYWGERVCAVLQLTSTIKLSRRDFNTWCSERLSSEQLPRQVMTISTFPMTSSGKLARAELKQQLTSQPDRFGTLDA